MLRFRTNDILNLRRHRAMSRDTRYYPNPEQFSPERYLATEVKDKGSVLLPSSFVFGFGRRWDCGHIARRVLLDTELSYRRIGCALGKPSHKQVFGLP